MNSFVGPYELLGEISRGGMGVVYRARHREFGSIVALKMLLGSQSDPETLERFHREARAASLVQHPHVVSVSDSGNDRGRAYFAMPLVEGQSLQQRVEEALRSTGEPPELGLVEAWMWELASALQACHEAGIVHRDVKPQNVMVDAEDRVMLVDFGLAKRDGFLMSQSIDGIQSLTTSGELVGTPAYLAPEQLDAKTYGTPGAASDVWAYGALAHFCLTGRPPFSGRSNLNLFRGILTEAPSQESDRSARVPRHLAEICRDCLRKDVEERPDFSEILERLEEGPSAARPTLKLAGLAVIAIALLFALMSLVYSNMQDETFRRLGDLAETQFRDGNKLQSVAELRESRKRCLLSIDQALRIQRDPKLLALRGRCHVSLEQLELAAADFDSAGESSEALYLRAVLELRLRRNDETHGMASELLSRAIAVNQEPYALAARSLKLFLERDYAAAWSNSAALAERGEIDFRILRATMHFQAQRLEEAAALLDQILEISPLNYTALELRLTLAIKRAERDLLEKLLSRLEGYQRQPVDALFAKSIAATTAEDSLRHMSDYLKRQPSSYAGRIGYARLLRRLSRLEEAAAEFRELIRRSPKRSEPYRHLAEILYAQKKYDDTVATLKDGLRKSEGEADRQVFVGFLSKRCPVQEFEAFLESVLKERADDPVSQFALARVMLRKRNVNAALERLEKLHKRRPDSSNITLEYASALHLSAQHEASRKVFRALMDSATAKANPLLIAARRCLSLHLYSLGREFNTRAANRDPDNLLIKILSAQLTLRLGRVRDARILFERLPSPPPKDKDSQAHILIGLAETGASDQEKDAMARCRKHAAQALSLSKSPEVLEGAARVVFLHGDLKELVKIQRRAKQLKHEGALIPLLVGQLYLKKGSKSQGFEHLGAARRLEFWWDEPYLVEAREAVKAKRKEHALAVLNEGLKRAPSERLRVALKSLQAHPN